MAMLKSFVKLAAAAILLSAAPAAAQIQNVDPNQAEAWQAAPEPAPEGEAEAEAPLATEDYTPVEAQPAEEQSTDIYAAPPAAAPAPESATVPRDDVFSAAEGLFGRGARGLAGILEDILREQGEPIAYIAGQEAGAAFMVGVRYGSGTMHHSIEGDRAVYWTGPSIGFDVGGDINKVFVLVYNLHDSQRLFRRYPGAEGRAYFVGGFSATYLRDRDVVLIPIRLGGGLRLGANVGYMRFSQRNRWLPF
ncbi:MAG TPA: DUF1134 domain-containing protein [Allosphingosinicella sp.]|nr:DUF1134 domain-containing protein [Allosphingosinicella sp.]